MVRKPAVCAAEPVQALFACAYEQDSHAVSLGRCGKRVNVSMSFMSAKSALFGSGSSRQLAAMHTAIEKESLARLSHHSLCRLLGEGLVAIFGETQDFGIVRQKTRLDAVCPRLLLCLNIAPAHRAFIVTDRWRCARRSTSVMRCGK
jgi:hypothetical protein